MNLKKKAKLIDKILSKYIFQNIVSYVPDATFKNIVKYNKKLQKDLDISLYTYQKLFLQNKLQICFKDVSFTKVGEWKRPTWGKQSDFLPSKKFEFNVLIEFLKKEFNNFNDKKDKKILEKIIKEILKEKELYKFEKIINTQKQIKLIDFNKKIKWSKDANIIELNLHSKDLEKSYFFNNSYDKDYIKNIKKIEIPTGLFPNLKILKIATNSIIPASLVMNLSKLYINLIPDDNLIFLNDIKKNEIELKNLKFLYIIRPEGFNDDNKLSSKDLEDKEDYDNIDSDSYSNEDNEEIEKDNDDNVQDSEESKENNNEEIENNSNKNKSGDKKSKNNKKIITKQNQIKFICNNLQELSIQIRPEVDNSFLYNYFNCDYFYEWIKDLKHNGNIVYKSIKEKVLNYKYMESLKYFKICIILMSGDYMLLPTFKMKKFINGLKRYTFKMKAFSDNSTWDCFKEIYEENEIKQRILKKYYNLAQIREIDDISLDGVNILKLKNREKKHRIFDANKIEKLLCINKNNYSIQEMSLNLKYFNDKCISQISKFKTLEKIVIHNSIKDIKILMKLIEDLSQLNLLKIILIRFRGNISSSNEKKIKKWLPKVKIGKESWQKTYKISQNYDEYDSVMEFSF